MKDLTGTWQLVRTSSSAGDGAPMPAPYGGEHAMGLVSFNADGRMICVLCDSRPNIPHGAAREFNSYCGAYSYDGKHLSTKVDASSNDAWFDTDQVRDVSFEGELMVLRPPLRTYSAQAEQRVLYWQRIS